MACKICLKVHWDSIRKLQNEYSRLCNHQLTIVTIDMERLFDPAAINCFSRNSAINFFIFKAPRLVAHAENISNDSLLLLAYSLTITKTWMELVTLININTVLGVWLRTCELTSLTSLFQCKSSRQHRTE